MDVWRTSVQFSSIGRNIWDGQYVTGRCSRSRILVLFYASHSRTRHLIASSSPLFLIYLRSIILTILSLIHLLNPASTPDGHNIPFKKRLYQALSVPLLFDLILPILSRCASQQIFNINHLSFLFLVPTVSLPYYTGWSWILRIFGPSWTQRRPLVTLSQSRKQRQLVLPKNRKRPSTKSWQGIIIRFPSMSFWS